VSGGDDRTDEEDVMTTAMVPAAAVVGGVVQVVGRSVEAVATMWTASEQTEQCRLQAAVAMREIERRKRAHSEEEKTLRASIKGVMQLAREGLMPGSEAAQLIKELAMSERMR
jgi:hypothetical protein